MDKLYILLSDIDEINYYQLAKELGLVSFKPDQTVAFFHEILRMWLSRENPKPSWNDLIVALVNMKYVELAKRIVGRYMYVCMYVHVYNAVVLVTLLARY